MAMLLGVLGVVALPTSLALRSAVAAAALIAFGIYTWGSLIRSGERAVLARGVGLSQPG
jgi:hypothetical protein